MPRHGSAPVGVAARTEVAATPAACQPAPITVAALALQQRIAIFVQHRMAAFGAWGDSHGQDGNTHGK